MKINSNIPAMHLITNMNKADSAASTAMQRLSSGIRINSAADDAAGLAISRKLDLQVSGLRQANRNTMDGISMIQTAEGTMGEVHSILQRARELTVQAANGNYTPEQRENIQIEIDQLTDQVKKFQSDTQFNKKRLLDGSQDEFILQTGANKSENIVIDGSKMNLDNIIKQMETIDVAHGAPEDITKNLSTRDAAITETSNMRAYLGACQNRLEQTSQNLSVSEENMTASLSRIYDADMAEEMTNYTQNNVLSQAATSMLAQANQRPQQVLQLLNS